MTDLRSAPGRLCRRGQRVVLVLREWFFTSAGLFAAGRLDSAAVSSGGNLLPAPAEAFYAYMWLLDHIFGYANRLRGLQNTRLSENSCWALTWRFVPPVSVACRVISQAGRSSGPYKTWGGGWRLGDITQNALDITVGYTMTLLGGVGCELAVFIKAHSTYYKLTESREDANW